MVPSFIYLYNFKINRKSNYAFKITFLKDKKIKKTNYLICPVFLTTSEDLHYKKNK